MLVRILDAEEIPVILEGGFIFGAHLRAERFRGGWMGRRLALGGLLALMCVAAIGCGGNPNPVPQINGLSPSSIPAGEGAFILSISGTNINDSSTVNVGTNQLTVLGVQTPPCNTPTNCPVILEVNVPASQVSAAGAQQVTITDAGQTSNAVTLNVLGPQILTMFPSAVPAGASSFPLTLTVVNASPSIQVQFGAAGKSNAPLTPAGPVSCNAQTACAVVVNIPASAVSTAGTVPVTVVNPFASTGGTAATSFLIAAASSSSSQFPIAQSASGGTLGNSDSTHSSVSDGGVFVAFDSTATNLTSGGGNGLSQVYLTQNCFGASNCTPQTTLISQAGGNAGSGGVVGSDRPAISADGRYVAFESDDTNLASSATQTIEQIYLYDTCNSISGPVKNCTPSMTLVSSTSGGPGNAPSRNPAISSYGLFIAYQSQATNLTSATVPANVQEIYLYQNCTSASGTVSGCATGNTLLSTDASGNAGDQDSVLPSIDPIGLAVSFESLADNIVSGVTSNGEPQIYLRTTCLETMPMLQTGCSQQTVMLSADSGNNPGTNDSITPTLTDDGNLFAAFASSAPNLMPGNASGQQILGETVCVTQPTTVACVPSGIRVFSVDQNGVPGVGASSSPSAAGTRMVFTSDAALLPNVSGEQVYGMPVCIAANGCTLTGTLISQSGGSAIGGLLGSVGGGGMAAFSTTGASGASGTGEIFLAAPF